MRSDSGALKIPRAMTFSFTCGDDPSQDAFFQRSITTHTAMPSLSRTQFAVGLVALISRPRRVESCVDLHGPLVSC
jgi:hypothetical protein